jgi:hypothetical protein
MDGVARQERHFPQTSPFLTYAWKWTRKDAWIPWDAITILRQRVMTEVVILRRVTVAQTPRHAITPRVPQWTTILVNTTPAKDAWTQELVTSTWELPSVIAAANTPVALDARILKPAITILVQPSKTAPAPMIAMLALEIWTTMA